MMNNPIISRVLLLCLYACTIALTLFAICSLLSPTHASALPSQSLSVWPKPLRATAGRDAICVSPSSFRVTSSHPSPTLKAAIERCQKRHFFPYPTKPYACVPSESTSPHVHSRSSHSPSSPLSSKPAATSGYLEMVVIAVAEDSDTELHIGVDESYELSILPSSSSTSSTSSSSSSSTSSQPYQATITSPTIWGALHALETLSQLITYSRSTNRYAIPNAPVSIQDAPRFAWRGLLLDTSRHFIPLPLIYRLIDALAMNKMNVFHWHSVDSESFPLDLQVHPELAQQGAYDPEFAVYSVADQARVVEYARARGVNVLMEIDVPGHSSAWGRAFPDILANCSEQSTDARLRTQQPISYHYHALDPTREQTYQVISDIFQEISERFPTPFLHIGGDEVMFLCWYLRAHIRQYIFDNSLYVKRPYDPADVNNFLKLERQFFARVFDSLAQTKRAPIVWQEVFDKQIPLPSDAVVHAWKDKMSHFHALKQGYRALLSSGWYLDRQLPVHIPTLHGQHTSSHYSIEDTWIDFYNNEPFEDIYIIPSKDSSSNNNNNNIHKHDNSDNGKAKHSQYKLTDEQANRFLGGEAAMWTEQVDQENLMTRIWPRACAVAERLWSARDAKNVEDARARLMAWRCRMKVRGMRGVGPIGQDYCPMPLVREETEERAEASKGGEDVKRDREESEERGENSGESQRENSGERADRDSEEAEQSETGELEENTSVEKESDVDSHTNTDQSDTSGVKDEL